MSMSTNIIILLFILVISIIKNCVDNKMLIWHN